MPEKDLAEDMKQKQQNKKLLEKIRKIEDEIKLEKSNDNLNVRYHEDCELTIGGNVIKVSVAEVEEKKDSSKSSTGLHDGKDSNNDKEETDLVKTYNIYMRVKGKDVKIAEINEEGRLIINKEELEKIDPENKLGLKELDDEKQEISEINKVEGKTSEELEEEISKEEKPEEEKTDELMEIEAEKQGMSKDELKSNMIELELDSIKVTENKTLRHILGIGNNYTRVFAVPGRDASEYTIKGLNKEGKLEELDNLKRVEGTNPNQKIANIDKEGKEVETKSTIAMFELEGKGMQEGITISQGQFDYKEVSYYRRTEDNEYISTPIAQKGGVDRDESSFETKEMMDRNRTTQDELSAHLDAYEELEELKEQEVPEEIDITKDGIQDRDIRMGKEEMIERLLKHPDYNYTKEEATEIVNNIIDKDMDFDEAREGIDNQKEKEKSEEEEYERTPWGDAEERRNRGY